MRGLEIDGRGRVWAATLNGLYRAPSPDAAFARVRVWPPGGASPGEDYVTVFEDGSRRIWVGSYGGGLLAYDEDRDRFRAYRHDPAVAVSLSDDRVFRIYEDRSGLLWVGTWNGGLNLADPSGGAFGLIRHNPADPGSLPHNDVTEVLVEGEDEVLVGLYERGVARVDVRTGRARLLADPVLSPPERSAAIYRLARARDGRLLVGTLFRGLAVGRPGAMRLYRHDPADSTSLPDDRVQALAVERDGTAWVGTVGGLASFDPGSGRFVRHRSLRGEPWTPSGDNIQVLYADAMGRLWVGTDQGLDRYEGEGRFRRLTRAAGAPDNPVRSILLASDGTLWVGTTSEGLYQVRSADGFRRDFRVTRLPVDLLPSPYIAGLEEDRYGRVWASTKHGLHRIDPATLAVESWFEEQGLQGDAFTSGSHARLQDGRLLFGGGGGLTVVDPAEPIPPGDPPAAVISSVRVGTGSKRFGMAAGAAPLQLTHDHGLVWVEFAVLDFRPPRDYRFEYRLSPDDPWQPVESGAALTFARLAPGRYTLTVRGRNRAGVVSHAAALPLAVTPPFWATWPFRLLVAALLLGGGGTLNGLRTRRMRERALELARTNRALEEQILERRAAEAARADLQEQLRHSERLKAVGQLTGGLAHDFNNLLTVILGNLELALQAVDDPRLRSLLEEVQTAGERGADLTRQLLAFGRRQSLRPLTVDPAELVARMSSLLKRTLGEAYEIEVDLSGQHVQCRVDPGALENAVLNLVLNARDAMPGGGRVVLRVHRARLEGDRARALDAPEGDYACIEVADSGSGIDAEAIDRIFEPFFSTKEVGKGTGLGLSMVYGFVRQSGGTVDVESEVGVGTQVRLYFPLAAGEGAAAPPVEPSAAVPAGRGERVLVVEDEDDVRRLAVRVLDGLGYVCLEAGDAAQAEALLEEHRVDVVLSDVVLPGGRSGVDLAEQIARRWPDVAVVLTSGYADGMSAERVGGAAHALLDKPYARETLARAVRDALDRPGGGAGGAAGPER
ncbi:MAG: hybrid sensor histidine kinase/response regulator [Gemmatimonadetes bacterium]|nr:MAG: hybrid sensor histidine kinase/response regulator [Gemmatimonadota bacterium]